MFSHEEMKAMTSVGGMGALAAAVRCIIDNQRSVAVFATTFVLCVFAALISGYIVKDMDISQGWKDAIVGASALTARELITATIRVAETIRDNSAALAKAVISRKKP